MNFSFNRILIYAEKHHFEEISNRLILKVAEKPTLVGIDFDGFLIDVNKEDYVWKLQL